MVYNEQGDEGLLQRKRKQKREGPEDKEILTAALFKIGDGLKVPMSPNQRS